MKSPTSLNVVLLIVATTGFYTWIGQLVPQKELQPPIEVQISKEITPRDLVKIGAEIADGKGLCLTCHTIGQTGALRFPDLAGISSRAATRREGMSQIDYMAESLYEPDSFVVEGFNPGMPAINKPPIGLSDEEILAVIAWLQSLGGEPTVALATTHAFRKGP